MTDAWQAWIDGAARGNPGPASFGARIEDPEGRLRAELKGRLGVATNNVAEYRALLALLDWALEHDIRNLAVRTDSKLLACQINGEWKVRHPGLKGLHMEARSLIAKLDDFEIRHVRRERNKEADRLANEALDEAVAP